jgi:hypothetical protein
MRANALIGSLAVRGLEPKGAGAKIFWIQSMADA